MRNPAKRSFVSRRLFDAEYSGRSQLPAGLSADERIQFALGLSIFTEDEREWLSTPDELDAFEQALAEWVGRAAGQVKVGFLQSALARVGGIETWNRTLLSALSDVHVCGMAVTVERADTYTEGIDVPIGIGVAAGSLLAESVDVLIVSNEFGLERVLAGARRQPKVVMVHHGDEACKFSQQAVMTQRRFIDRLVAVNPRVPSLYHKWLKCSHIPLTVDRRRCKPTVSREVMRAEVALPQDADVVLYAGRFSIEKGYQLARSIGEQLPDDMFMVMMGGYGDRDHPRIRYVGQHTEPGNWYHAADIAISTSVVEGFGLSMLEMISAGLPLVSTARGIVAEHPSIARVVNPEAPPSEWVETIVDDLRHSDEACVRVEDAQQLLDDLYGFDSFAHRWNVLLREVAD